MSRFLIIFTLLGSFTGNAQLTKHNWLMGGSGKFQYSKTKTIYNGTDQSSIGTTLLISPNIGYFLLDKFAVGLSPSFAFSNPSGNNNSSTGYGIGPFVRYYFLNPENKVNILSHLGYSYGHSKNVAGSWDSHNTYLLKAGPVVYFNRTVALELTLDYEIIRSKDYSGGKAHSYAFSIGAGFQIHLEKK